MTSIGEKLEEARKRQGISIREAAEETKLRSDFLLSFENNNFEIDLPDVYRRGFLKLYAHYLKLDVDKITTDYNAKIIGNGKNVKKDTRDHLGRMELPSSGKKQENTKPPQETQKPFGDEAKKRENVSNNTSPITDTTLYWKVGIIFVGIFVLVGLVALLVSALSGPSEPEIVANNVIEKQVVENSSSIAQEQGIFKIIAKDNVLNVMVRQDLDRKKLYGGPMKAGEEIVIDRIGPVRVASSDIDKITIEINGKRFNSPVKGVGQIPLGMNGPI